MAEGAYLAVARIRKPHGLKGEVVAWLHTDEPDVVLAAGRELVPIDEHGDPVGDAVTIERSRKYHRHWLLKFTGVDDRVAVEEWRERLLGAKREELRAPDSDELYEHELPGVAVIVGDAPVGVVVGLMESPSGQLLAIDVGGREVLIPFRRPIVRHVDRDRRQVVLDPPDGLLEL